MPHNKKELSRRVSFGNARPDPSSQVMGDAWVDAEIYAEKPEHLLDRHPEARSEESLG
jgi:hypothetical protein